MICIMATRRVEIGPTGETVRANVARIRKQHGLTLRDVADRLGQAGRPMAHNTVSEIERGARRVDVDDLMALAAALNAAPVGLLFPLGEKDQEVEVTGKGKARRGELWEWLTGFRPTRSPTSIKERLAWLANSRPDWTMKLTGDTPDVVVTQNGDD